MLARGLVLSTCLVLSAQAADAGGWEALPGGGFHDCDFRFSGPIRPGDLTGHLDELANAGSLTPRICLNSEGGSLAEVYRFIQLVAQGDFIATVQTHVESDAACLSSCAILFMFGQAYGANSPYPSRQLAPGARLGFHSPFIAPEQAKGADAEDAFRVALQVSRLLVDSSYRALTMAGPAIPPELVALILGTPSDEMYHVDTIGELTLLGIETTTGDNRSMTLANDRRVIAETVRRICASSHVMSNRTHFVEDGYAFGDLVAAVDEMMGFDTQWHHMVLQKPARYQPARIVAMVSGPYAVPGWYSAGAALFCQVELMVEDNAGGFRITDYRVGFGGPSFDWNSRLAHPDEITRADLEAGLVPIDRRYR